MHPPRYRDDGADVGVCLGGACGSTNTAVAPWGADANLMLLELESDPPHPRARRTAKSSVFDHFEHVGTLSVSDPDAL